ncbi:hypothetical protein DVH24_036527 [Malus domestica]|uniref:Uncharacterized protein n=1 Tax=Malus domestica TaxID=3750 RepID=A0A498IFQ0_MALDO|nr:hypothetical protein DVH24_036527 [Malus domestica]
MASPTPDAATLSILLAAIDMGTNSFKLLIVRAYPDGIFFTIGQFKEPLTPVRCVATAAVREAVNKAEFLECVREEVGLEVDVLPGEEEARLVYLGMAQFLPIYEKLVLGVDIEGGSTEFVYWKGRNVVLGASLKLGHVNLTQKFGASEGNAEIMRNQIRLVGNLVSFGDGKRDWKLSRGEVKGVVGVCAAEERRRGLGRGSFIKGGRSLWLQGQCCWRRYLRCLELRRWEETFEALRKFDHLTNIQVAASLDAKDLEYLEAACVLHNIGISVGKKGYHKHSCSIITKGNHLHGYSTEEVKLIALLAKHHRKNLPNFDHVSFKEFPEQTCSSVKDQNYPPGIVQTLAEDIGDELRQEFAHFKMACQEELYIVVPSSASE